MYSYPVQLLGRLFLKTLLSSSHKSKVETLPNRKVEMKTILGATKQQLLLLSELPLVGGRLIEKHQSANNKQLKGSVQRHMAVCRLMMMSIKGRIDEQGGIRDGSSSGSQGSQGSD